jgi:TrmH family RNA methyltransferase
MKTISSRDNAGFKALSKLATSSGERRRKGLSLIEGEHLLQAVLDAGMEPESIVVNAAALEDRAVARLLERSPARVTVLSDALFNSLSAVESPTGVIAVVKTPGSKKVPPTASLVLLLEDIQDPGNVGTLLAQRRGRRRGPRAALRALRLRLVAQGAALGHGRAFRAEHRRGCRPRRFRGLVPGELDRAFGRRGDFPL